jgi:hypothetical protein
MMTRKDYVATAEILKSFAKPYMEEALDYDDLVEEFAAMFESDNPNFKVDTFRKACEVI